ncbi:MAG: hypothetical protein OXB93_00105, partial [Cytophagales bacterium]|nr:hypothetical protein [Cytophagales bacterium]
MDSCIFSCLPWYLRPICLNTLIIIILVFVIGVLIYTRMKEKHRKKITLWGIAVGSLALAFVFFFCYLGAASEDSFLKDNNDTIRTALTLAVGILGIGGIVLSVLRIQRTDKQIKISQKQVKVSQEANYLSSFNLTINMLHSDSDTQKLAAIGILHNIAVDDQKRVKRVFEAFLAFVKEVKIKTKDPEHPESWENPFSRIKSTIVGKITEDKIYSKYRKGS